MKNGKAPGINSLQAELLKADIGSTSRLLTDLFSKMLEQEVIPKDRTKGLIFTLPKKGDLGNCDNWREITLLSVQSKVFCRILLKHIDKAINTTLREEQAGFRRGRGCMNQIFALRKHSGNSLSNGIDGRSSKHIDYHLRLSILLRCSMITSNAVSSLETPSQKHFQLIPECAMAVYSRLFSSSFTIDWVIRQATSLRTRGIQWTIFSHLQDLDFANDTRKLRGRPKPPGEKTVETSLNEWVLSWGEAQAIAKDKTRWKRDIVAAPCPTGGY